MSGSLDGPTAEASTLGHLAYRTGRLLGRVEAAADRVPPWAILAALTVASWVVAAEAGRIAAHDGWLYYNGGDATWYYTTAWTIASGHIPTASIGYGYPLLLVPIALVAGRSVLDAIPAIVVFNQLVLAPVALVCVYGIVRMYASRWYASLASLLWVLAPVAVIHYFLADYHSRYVDMTLPSEVGLLNLGDYPSMVFLLVAAYFLLRAVQTRAALDVVAAGLAAGFALVVKPANLLFLLGAVLALAVARRPRELGVFAAALVPAVIGLALWKYRGLGYLPALGHKAASAPATATVAPDVTLNFGRYVHLDWWHLHQNLDAIREFTWSQRMAYFAALGGMVGLARRSWVAMSLAAGWFGAYLVVKGANDQVDFVNGSFLTHMIAAFPAYFLLATAVPFLVPIWGRRRPPSPVDPGTSQTLPRVAVGVLAFLTAAGLLAVAALPALSTPAAVDYPIANLYVPTDGFTVAAKRSGGTVRLAWAKRQPSGTAASYAVFRGPSDPAACYPVHHAASTCVVTSTPVGSTTGEVPSFADKPPPGTWTYRVALSASAFGGQSSSDLILLSRPVTVTVPAPAH
jgi:hypothetical protein